MSLLYAYIVLYNKYICIYDKKKVTERRKKKYVVLLLL